MMALPAYERVVFAKSPLRLVVGQVRFPILLRFGEGGFLAPFHEALRSEYPQVSRENQVALSVSPKGLESSLGEPLWRFRTRDGGLSVIIGESAITLEAQQGGSEDRPGYSTADDFLGRFARILSVAQDSLGIAERSRLGLRYVNELRHPGARTLEAWGKLLNPDFVGFAASDLLEGQVEHTLQEVQVQRTDGTLAIRHGLVSGSIGEPVPARAPAGGHFYLIDLDYYDARACSLDAPSTLAQLQRFNDVTYRFFRWTLGETLYRALEPVNGI